MDREALWKGQTVRYTVAWNYARAQYHATKVAAYVGLPRPPPVPRGELIPHAASNYRSGPRHGHAPGDVKKEGHVRVGTVTHFNMDKGFGFIAPNDSDDDIGEVFAKLFPGAGGQAVEAAISGGAIEGHSLAHFSLV